MKLWSFGLSIIITLGFFSGCTDQRRVNNLQLIETQRIQITNLSRELKELQVLQSTGYSSLAESKRKKLCKKPRKIWKKKKPVWKKLKKICKPKFKAKKVQDKNFNSTYMYPTTTKIKKPLKKVDKESKVLMSKVECIGMIGQVKFDKYTQIFGNESASIKRCAMMKAMRS